MKRPTLNLLWPLVLALWSVAPVYPQSTVPLTPDIRSALDVSPSARAAGLGDCFAPISDDSSALFFNPAGLAQLERGDLSVMHFRYTNNTIYESTAYAMPFPNRGGWGVHLGYIDYGAFPRTGTDGSHDGTYNVHDLTAGAAFGFPVMKDLSAGLQTSWTSQTVDRSTRHGLWWDLGFMARASHRLQLGLALKNMGVVESGNSQPFALQWGFAFRGWDVTDKKDGLLLCAGSTYAPQGSHHLNAGLEFNHQERFFFRVGYSPDLKTKDLGASQGVNIGSGLRIHQFQLDYALTLGDVMGEFHRVSISYLFPSIPPQPTLHLSETIIPKPKIVAPPPEEKRFSPPPSTSASNGLQSLQKVDDSSDKGGDGKSLVVIPFKVEDTTLMTAEECLAAGREMERHGKSRDALKYYLAAIEKNPNNDRAWLLQGNLQVRMGMDAYREALRLNPQNESLRQWLENHR